MTIVWFISWLIANSVGANEPLALDSMNGWTATLILAFAFDVNRPVISGDGTRRQAP